ncbi:MAG: prepilin-type N-terminal cleavage/methylation domain-containing protein [Candidatus Saccharimonadales bacterium]
MSIKDIKKMQEEKGFTIVELLIVIVIIGILSAIVIVSYTGLTARANDSAFSSDAETIVKAIEAYNADVGSYPTSTNVTSGKLVAPTGFTLTATMPQSVYIVPNTNTSNDTAIATASCTTADAATPYWAVCKDATTGVDHYAVKMSTTGACVYYLKTASPAAVKNLQAGAPGTC